MVEPQDEDSLVPKKIDQKVYVDDEIPKKVIQEIDEEVLKPKRIEQSYADEEEDLTPKKIQDVIKPES